MKKMQKTFSVSAVIALALLCGAPAAKAQVVVDLVDAMQQEYTARGWNEGNGNRMHHPTRELDDIELAQCFQDALASGDYPDIEAAWVANLAYCNTALANSVAWSADPENEWNTLEAEYLTFVLMNFAEDTDEQEDFFTGWWVGWANAFDDDLASEDISNVDFSAQAAVEEMYDICLFGPPPLNLTLGVEGATFAEEGGSITLSANEEMMAPFQWKLDGANIGGETNATFSLSPTTTDDSGVYTLDFDDGEAEAKATVTSNPVSVSIFPGGTLPVSGLLGLGILAVASALGGVVALRKK